MGCNSIMGIALGVSNICFEAYYNCINASFSTVLQRYHISPCIPVDPLSPFEPAGPVAPVLPMRPGLPSEPGRPLGPTEPASPLIP